MMTSTMKCPYCPTSVHVSGTALMATCPNCHNTFKAVHDPASIGESRSSGSIGHERAQERRRTARCLGNSSTEDAGR